VQEYVELSAAQEAVAKYHEGHFLGAQIKVEISRTQSGAQSAPVDGSSFFLSPMPRNIAHSGVH
jgi:hypothetical protein